MTMMQEGRGVAIRGQLRSSGALGSPAQTVVRIERARVPVAVYAEDVILHAGVMQQLRHRPEVQLLTEEAETAEAAVSLVVVDGLTEAAVQRLQQLRRTTHSRTGLIVSRFENGALQRVIECGVGAVMRRGEASPDKLVHLVTALAKGEGVMPGDLLSELLDHVGTLQRSTRGPRGLSLSALTTREAEMLRLVSEGFDTSEIAAKTSYSERTVKNVLHEIATRLGLRNRAHAVGYALRHGLI
jgi:DNA-binding NarL/FixJ family response regulator